MLVVVQVGREKELAGVHQRALFAEIKQLFLWTLGIFLDTKPNLAFSLLYSSHNYQKWKYKSK